MNAEMNVEKNLRQPLHKTMKNLIKHRYLYIMLLPGVVYFLIFHYAPMFGISIAFKDYNIIKGIGASPWAGFKYFKQAFGSPFFFPTVLNTLIISIYKLIFGFPAPIILALLLNEVTSTKIKRGVQTISYLPHFISWVVIGGMMTDLLSPQSGIINHILQMLGKEPIYFLASKEWFRPILVLSDIWKEVGWGSIIYLAALSGIDPQLYEAAEMDGCGRWRQTWYITLPGILGTISIMLILRLGSILNAGFEQIFILYNPSVYQVADIIDTWVYRTGVQGMQYSLATAVGLFKSLIGFTLVVTSNWLSQKMSETGIW